MMEMMRSNLSVIIHTPLVGVNRWNSFFFFLSILATIGGCVPVGATYELGLGTSEVRGRMVLGDGTQDDWHPLIVVYKYHYKFIPQVDDRRPFVPVDPTQQTSITHPTAHIVRVGEAGNFVISMPADVVAVHVIFMARQRLSDVFRYSRSLGVGRITYQANLPVMGAGWRSHFYTFLEPQLQNLIVDERYQLQLPDQKVLSDWLGLQREFLDTSKKKKTEN